jgi:two-component system chemotaxis response regulator CheB
MRLRPMPVVMVSTLTAQGAPAALEALALGAVDVMAKPRAVGARDLGAYADSLREKVKAAAHARVQLAEGALQVAPLAACNPRAQRGLLAIGASAGGTEAIRAVLGALPADAPPTVIVQHIPASFSSAFAERLDRHSAMRVLQLEADQALQSGHAYLAPGGRHVRVVRSGGQWWGRLGNDPPRRRHRPSVDVLFESVAQSVGAQAAAALLTGMGDDGARGLLALRDAGALTIAQDEASSLIWGMPGAAVALDAAREVLPLSQIAQRLLGDGGAR